LAARGRGATGEAYNIKRRVLLLFIIQRSDDNGITCTTIRTAILERFAASQRADLPAGASSVLLPCAACCLAASAVLPPPAISQTSAGARAVGGLTVDGYDYFYAIACYLPFYAIRGRWWRAGRLATLLPGGVYAACVAGGRINGTVDVILSFSGLTVFVTDVAGRFVAAMPERVRFILPLIYVHYSARLYATAPGPHSFRMTPGALPCGQRCV